MGGLTRYGGSMLRMLVVVVDVVTVIDFQQQQKQPGADVNFLLGTILVLDNPFGEKTPLKIFIEALQNHGLLQQIHK